jgi:diacylglycerol kinase family enzyme
VIATTMSGSIQDQRKIVRIEPEFRELTSRSVRVHTADSHSEAQAIARDVVTRGARIIVSAGGAGTFNAVLEGAHVNGALPPDVKLGFLRKGSADLIGKVLGIPDDLSAATQAIVGAIEEEHHVAADVLAVGATLPDGQDVRRHMVGFGGAGIFGEVPRFTESRFIKLYKGVLGSLFGDYGPFTVGLSLAAVSWLLQRRLGRVPPMSLTLDDERIPAATWGAVVVVNGDLGSDFPLGRGLPLDGGVFRVVALRYKGLSRALRQMKAARSGTVLDDPDRYDAVVRSVRRLTLHPEDDRPFMVNVDGGRLVTRGEVRIKVSGRIELIGGE